MKNNVYKTILEVVLIALSAWLPFLVFHVARVSYLRWKSADGYAKKVERDFRNYKEDVEARKPDLRPEITLLVLAPAGEKEADVVVMLSARISNLGSPGVVLDFWMDLELSDSRVLHGEFPIPPARTVKLFFGETPSGKMYFSGANHLVNTVAANPLDTNAATIGWLTAVFRGITKQQVIDQKGVIVLTCSDVTGRKTSARRDFGQGDAPMQPPIFGFGEIQKQKSKKH